VTEFLHGMATAGFLAVAVWFLRSWLQTRDRLLLAFAIAFAVLGGNRVVIAATEGHDEAGVAVYVVRAAAFLLIIAAVLDRNRRVG
jgi:hypothetical protein